MKRDTTASPPPSSNPRMGGGNAAAVDLLRKYWGYDSFRPLQEDIIDAVLDGRDVLGLLPTGGGKSITFQVPALMLPGLTIVVTPLISLMKDQVDSLLQRGIRAYCLHSGLTRSEARLAIDKCRVGKAKILYVSPERLQSDSFIDNIREWDVSLIVVDEAHCISQWGYDFRPSYLKIKKLRQLFPSVNVLALTASATPEVAEDIMAQLEFRPGYRKFAKSFARPNISYVVRYDEYKDRAMLRVLKSTDGCAIVYVRSRRRTRELSQLLESEGISASYYHAGLDPEEKEARQNAWKNDEKRVMVATNAFGMGIDKPDVRVVIHYDLPSSLEEYYQEAGRAGRDGLPSYAVVIAARSDKALLTRRISDSFPPKEFIAKVYEMAGNFLDIAVGSGYQQVYEFDFVRFCQIFQFPAVQADAALRILTNSEYVTFVDEVQSRSRVMIIASKHELYQLDLDPVADRIFSELQRAYTGLFADYVHINEGYISRRAEATPEQVYQTLLLLSRMHVISYVPKQATPYLYYPTSREEPRYLVLPKVAYEDRKSRMEHRIEAMKKFVFDSTECRVQSMLRYFGEEIEPCGTCDVCREYRAHAKLAANSEQRTEAELMRASVQYLLNREGGCSVQEILDTVKGPRHELIELIRELMDEAN